jgi:hypothetical protein
MIGMTARLCCISRGNTGTCMIQASRCDDSQAVK